MPQTLLPARAGEHSPLDEMLMAFLAEKGRRSGSRRTVEGYARMLWPFFQRLGKTPDQVTPPDVLGLAHGIGLSGRVPSSTTVGARIACLSSFYRFLIRMNLATFNPCDALERPRSVTAPARGYSATEVRRLLAVLPDTVRGRPGPGDPADAPAHRPAAVGGHQPQGRRPHRRGRDGLLLVSREGRQERPPRAPSTGLRGDRPDAGRLRQGAGVDGPGRVALAGGDGLSRADERDVLRAVPALPAGGRPGADRASTSLATPRRSSDGMPASRSRRCRRSWTTRRWR